MDTVDSILPLMRKLTRPEMDITLQAMANASQAFVYRNLGTYSKALYARQVGAGRDRGLGQLDPWGAVCQTCEATGLCSSDMPCLGHHVLAFNCHIMCMLSIATLCYYGTAFAS